MALLKVSNLEKSYNITKTQKQEVLKGINIEFKSGDLVALLGESGCGKSTLINILGGLDMDYTGSVVIKGDFIRDFTEKQMDDYRKKRVGLIFQNYNLIPHMTVKENIEIAMKVSDIDSKVSSERADDLLKMVGLLNFANKMPNQLSGGQKQRVAIARALANNPTILLADEPTGALDEDASQVVMEILKKIAESGKLVIIVTHSQKVANQCGRIIKMENGVISEDRKNNKINIQSSRDKEIIPKNINTKNVFKLAKNNIKQKLSRNMLVSVGMAVGIMVVMLIMCLSSGLANYVNKVYSENTLSLQMEVTSKSLGTITDTTLTNVNQLDGIDSIIKTYQSSGTYTYYSTSSSLQSIKTYYLDEYYPEMLYGSVKENDDNLYIIINESMANAISTDGSLISCIGNTITLKINSISVDFKISGIYEEIEDDTKTRAYISEDSMLSLLNTSSLSINTLYITAENVSYVSALKEDLKKLGLTVLQVESSADSVMEYIDLGTNILTAVAAVSLLVSAIMIFIVLYISVHERMKEIGILRSIGARKKDIQKMFLFEAGMLGLIAGVMAVGVCFILSLATNLVCLSTLKYSLISYHIGYYLLGILLSIIISVCAGIAPAIKASDLDPVESLRAE